MVRLIIWVLEGKVELVAEHSKVTYKRKEKHLLLFTNLQQRLTLIAEEPTYLLQCLQLLMGSFQLEQRCDLLLDLIRLTGLNDLREIYVLPTARKGN